MVSVAQLYKCRHVLLALALMLLIIPVGLQGQSVEKDSTHWVGEWRDDGNLQYAYHLHLQPLGGGRMSGYFDWKLIWTWLPAHKSKIGATAREYVVGVYDPVKRQLKVSGIRHTDPADIISMDIYIIDVSADGKSIEGINVKPENYHGSMFGIIQPPKRPIAAKKPTPNPSNASKSPSKEAAKPNPGPTKPGPAPAVNPGPKASVEQPRPVVVESPPPAATSKPAQDAELKSREIVTKQEFRSTENTIRIRVFDESMIDGDVISLNWNGTWILRYYRIARLPKEMTLELKQGENTLVMHAENLGRYPPNTASISVQRGTKTEVLVLNSDMGKSEAIRIIRD